LSIADGGKEPLKNIVGADGARTGPSTKELRSNRPGESLVAKGQTINQAARGIVKVDLIIAPKVGRQVAYNHHTSQAPVCGEIHRRILRQNHGLAGVYHTKTAKAYRAWYVAVVIVAPARHVNRIGISIGKLDEFAASA
jgi:hypothetical protein